MQLDASEYLRYLRTYLRDQLDLRRVKGPVDRLIKLSRVEGGIDELECPSVQFVSESRLEFKIRLEPNPPGWRVRQFMFHLNLPARRAVTMVRIHLNHQQGHDPVSVPRCHLHIGRGAEPGKAHIRFPVMSPLLMLHLICEVIEPDFAA